MRHTLLRFLLIACTVLAAGPVLAQTTLPGPEVDIEVVNPTDGSNAFCVAPSTTFNVRIFLRPGTGVTTCTLSCSPPDLDGGSANLATGVVDLAFDSAVLSYVADSAQGNPATAAVQGLPRENAADGRIGWAQAGSWSSPGDPASGLLSPCEMEMLTTADWLFQLQLRAEGPAMTNLHLRRETDPAPFALSFADICGSDAFTQSNGGIDEVRDAIVLISEGCSGALFFDNFSSGDTSRWSAIE
ncbi:MAG: hypothetical protein V2I67_19935 [Thermoanaerobaculales bacterium]|jgi:hypothetical protein|nr:hypothetical protein [Thermoanaerobaculales bacterium]